MDKVVDKAMDKVILFPKIPINLSLKEKLKIIITRHENDYFKNREIEDLVENFEEVVRPTVKVTENLLKLFLKRDTKAKLKKLIWVYKSNEPFALEFKNKIERNSFNSVADAQDEAAKIYKDNCNEYQQSKETVSSLNWAKQVKRKQADDNNIDQPVQNTQAEVNRFLKKDILDAFENKFKTILQAVSLSNNELKTKLLIANDSNDYVKNFKSYEEPTKYNERLACHLASVIYDIVNKL